MNTQLPTDTDYDQIRDAIIAINPPVHAILDQLQAFELEDDWHGETPTHANVGELYALTVDLDCLINLLTGHASRLEHALRNMAYLRQQRAAYPNANLNGGHAHDDLDDLQP